MNRRKKRELEVELIPVFEPHEEFQKRKAEVQDLLVAMLINAQNKEDEEQDDEEKKSSSLSVD